MWTERVREIAFTAFALSVTLSGCASLHQVSKTQPHGNLLVRVIYDQTPATHVELLLDEGELVRTNRLSDRSETRARVRPGRHYLTISALAAGSKLSEVTVYQPHQQCILGNCTNVVYRPEQQYRVVPGDTRGICARDIAFETGPKSETTVLVTIGPRGECETCITDDADARSCFRLQK